MDPENIDISKVEAATTDEELEALLADAAGEAQESNSEDSTDALDDEAQAEGESAQAKGDAGDHAETETAEKEEPSEPKPVIKSRDGQHDIPYSVLEHARRRAKELENELNALREQQASMQKQAPEVTQSSTDTTDTGEDDFDIEAFADEYGEDLARPIKIMQQRIAAAERAAREAAERASRYEQDREAEHTASIEDAIDSVFADSRAKGEPSILRKWQQEGDPRWAAAVTMDQQLMQDPNWADKPLRARFEQVVTLLGQAPKPNPRDPRSDAAKRLASLDDGQGIPASLSDLPGGEFPQQSELETIERMTPQQIADLSPERLEEFLARL